MFTTLVTLSLGTLSVDKNYLTNAAITTLDATRNCSDHVHFATVLWVQCCVTV